MAMNTQVSRVSVRSIEHDVVWSSELGAGHDFDANAENAASINGIWVGVFDLERRYGCASSVETLLVVRVLGFGSGEDLVADGLGFRGECNRAAFLVVFLEGVSYRIGRDEGCGLDLQFLLQRGGWAHRKSASGQGSPWRITYLLLEGH